MGLYIKLYIAIKPRASHLVSQYASKKYFFHHTSTENMMHRVLAFFVAGQCRNDNTYM